jgi:2-polyprenyl-3-methyl-5-hydroxy-6-metoxy-1,4-benzoquinol methylase
MTTPQSQADSAEFDTIYRTTDAPWEIGRPQPALTPVIATEIRGPKVLDLGCGTGDLAIALARHGYDVTGVDISAVAIDTARAKAAQEGLNIHFEVQSATELALTGGPFDTLVDCGLLHNLHRRGGTRVTDFLARLPGLATPSAALVVLAIAIEPDQPWGVTEDLLHTWFAAPAWTGARTEKTEIIAEVDGERLMLPGFLLRATRSATVPQ